jgi:hypothetical protein
LFFQVEVEDIESITRDNLSDISIIGVKDLSVLHVQLIEKIVKHFVLLLLLRPIPLVFRFFDLLHLL